MVWYDGSAMRMAGAGQVHWSRSCIVRLACTFEHKFVARPWRVHGTAWSRCQVVPAAMSGSALFHEGYGLAAINSGHQKCGLGVPGKNTFKLVHGRDSRHEDLALKTSSQRRTASGAQGCC